MSLLLTDYMSKEVPTILDSVTVTEAAKTMTEADKGFLIVLKAGKPTGIVTENDFIKKVVARELNPKKVLVRDIMSSPIIAINPDEDLFKASNVMNRNNIRRLPVIKDGIIYGIITEKDIIKHCRTYAEQLTRDIIKWNKLLPITS